MMETYTIGIDTGGTYTDAVLIDSTNQKVIATAKQPTTHYDLAIGITQALTSLLHDSGIPANRVASLAVSTTLATNSVVENTGARVVLLVIGYVKHFRLPVKAVVFIDGGHDIDGKEEVPLDIEGIVDVVSRLHSEVDAYGVCSAMSMHNPSHELVAEKAIQMIDSKPVFCSHRISSLVGMKERAATAGLHAKLMPVMNQFVDGVERSMAELGLTCPIVIVGGNGDVIDPVTVVDFAGLTVASGPACSAFFGARHCEEDCLVVDVGGTTTDISYISSGRPQLNTEGCVIGRWQTHMETVDMLTGGIGGDSHAYIDDQGKLCLGPGRVVPLATAAQLPDIEQWLADDDAGKIILVHTLEGEDVTGNELADVLKKSGHATPKELRKATGLGGIPLEQQLEELVRRQLVYASGFTPTDALHVLGKLDFGKKEIAVRAASILGTYLKLGAEEFSRKVIDLAEERIEQLILDYVIQRYWGNSMTSFLEGRRQHPVLGVEFSLNIPLVGIGAAAHVLLPGVAKRLRTSVFFPEHCEVGNAIGSALLGLRALHKTAAP